ncbi:hypothetical protein [Kitasatospora sp. NPDC090091]|uniref:hypothetical protein n=1 Tax=Kitasatospora sp. NPDC090091 TaxID=3364081 RepID=UPI003817D410
MTGRRVWGRWWPIDRDVEGPVTNPLEWWPSRTGAEQALLDRLAPTVPGAIPRCRENLADGRTVEDAQYFGNKDSRIYLYEVAGEPGAELTVAEAPYAVVEFGPRGGVRNRPLAPAQVTR